jgi:type IV pilus assembly protein PilY1
MKNLKCWLTISTIILFSLVFIGSTAFADDTCVFMVTADNVEPNIVVLLDNGAEMQHAVWLAAYDDSVNYTPVESGQVDIVPNGAGGNGFFSDTGYGIDEHGGQYYLVKVLENLEVGSYSDGIQADSSDSGAGTGTWTINGNTVTLPVEATADAATDPAGVSDNAGTFRFSKNYLNWMFFSGNYFGDGSDLPDKSRFYYAKTAIMTVAKLAANQAKFGIYNFTDNASGAYNVQPLGMVVNTPLAGLPENNTLESNFVNNINNMSTVTFSPLAEGLARVGGYYGSPSSSVVGYYCQNNFVIVVSPGISSEDQEAAAQSSPASLSDYDGDVSIGEGNIMVD